MRHPRKTAVANMHFFVSSFSSKYWNQSSRLHESSILAVFKTALVVFFEQRKSSKLQFYHGASSVLKMFTRLQRKTIFFENVRKPLFFQCFLFFFALQERSQDTPGSPLGARCCQSGSKLSWGASRCPQIDPKSTEKLIKICWAVIKNSVFAWDVLKKLQLRTYIVLLACFFQNIENRALAYTRAPI